MRSARHIRAKSFDHAIFGLLTKRAGLLGAATSTVVLALTNVALLKPASFLQAR